MAAQFATRAKHIRLLDPGAGVGSLTAAFVEEVCSRKARPSTIHVTAYEVDAQLARACRTTMRECAKLCKRRGVEFAATVLEADFIADGVRRLQRTLFESPSQPDFTCAILNPPYRKMGRDSRERQLLRRVGVETSNLYAAFFALSVLLLKNNGELVAITPRSFCNGPYFTAVPKASP